MRRINTYALYLLGKNLAPIGGVDEDNSTYGDVLWVLLNTRMQINELLSNATLPVKTCRQAATQLVQSIDSVVPADIQEAFKQDKSAKVDWWSLQQIKDAATKFETVFAEELAIVDTYSVTQKGAYSTTELITNAEALFSKDVQQKLPQQAIQDIREAGKCLAFETPTAAAFHIVRAIESVILAYYAKVLGRAPPSRMRNWGVYIKTLRDSGKADTKILDFLKHIKDNYRNPISHPEAVLTIDEVLVLVSVAVGAMSQMAASL